MTFCKSPFHLHKFELNTESSKLLTSCEEHEKPVSASHWSATLTSQHPCPSLPWSTALPPSRTGVRISQPYIPKGFLYDLNFSPDLAFSDREPVLYCFFNFCPIIVSKTLRITTSTFITVWWPLWARCWTNAKSFGVTGVSWQISCSKQSYYI